jgi:hypothetical protein
LVFILIHPHFLNSIIRSREQAQPFSLDFLDNRYFNVIQTSVLVFAPLEIRYLIAPLRYALYLVVPLVPMLICLVWLWQSVLARRTDKLLIPPAAIPAFLAVTCWASIVVLYLFGLSPLHAMGPRYISFVTPYVFIALALVAQQHRAKIPMAIVVSALLVYQLIGATFDTVQYASAQMHNLDAVDQELIRVIVVDSVDRGVLPPVLWNVPSDSLVFAASQDNLMLHLSNLLSLGVMEFTYLSVIRYGNTEEKRQLILEHLARHGYNNISDRGTDTRLGGAHVYLVGASPN